MTPQDQVAEALALYLAVARPWEIGRYVAMILERLGLHRDEVRMWGFGVPIEEL